MLNWIKASFNIELTKDRCRDSGMALLLILLLVMAFTKSSALLPYAIIILIINMIWSVFFYPFAYIWFGLTNLIGSVVSKILLAIIFFLLVTPVGLFRRMLGKDSLQLHNFKKSSSSVMKERNHSYTKEDVINPF
jgi:hypothetical protein